MHLRARTTPEEACKAIKQQIDDLNDALSRNGAAAIVMADRRASNGSGHSRSRHAGASTGAARGARAMPRREGARVDRLRARSRSTRPSRRYYLYLMLPAIIVLACDLASIRSSGSSG